MIRSLVACAWDVESHVVKLSDGNDLPYEPKTRPNADEEVVYMGQTKSDVCVPPPPVFQRRTMHCLEDDQRLVSRSNRWGAVRATQVCKF